LYAPVIIKINSISMLDQTIAHYKVTAKLGQGGMGEVYRARDSRLNREVAVKVLPEMFAADPERMNRFSREAQVLASLNHPNIASIYGLEKVDGQQVLVMELVEGEDLSQRIARGTIPLDEAWPIALQIAEALENAHEKGFIHRDLKPGNVKVTPEGTVKVLDFGLAKALDPVRRASNPSAVDWIHSQPTAFEATLPGLILGTAAYMSPEQAKGKSVDRRTDIWAFGCVLYEMLAGRPAFDAETVTEVLAAVITGEPEWSALPKATPPGIQNLLRRCLRKDPRQRLRDIGEARIAIAEALNGRTEAEVDLLSAWGQPPGSPQRFRRSRERWLWAAVALALGSVGAVLTVQRLTETPEPRPAARFVLDTPQDVAFWSFSSVAMSPDGRHVAFIGVSPGGGRQLWLRSMESVEARALPGTEGALGGHFWSADSTSIAFAVERELRKVAVATGTVQRVCALPYGEFDGGTWSAEGTIVISHGWPRDRLYSVSGVGRELRPLTSLDESRGETSHLWPQFLPDGRHLLFLVTSREAGHAGLHVISLEAPEERRLLRPEAARFQYAGTGHLLFVQGGTLLAQRFDARELVTTGEAVPIASDVGTFSENPSWGWFSASAAGRAAWLSGHGGSDVRLEWIDREGRRVGALGEPGRYGQIALSPDDRRVAVEVVNADSQYDLWVFDVARGVGSRLTTDPGNERDPVWSPDSQAVVFSSDASGDQNLLLKGLQGSEPAAPLPGGSGQSPGERDIAEHWSREGNTLIYMTLGEERTFWALPMDGSGPPEALMKDGFEVDEPQVSPDGRWLAYISTESGRFEVYVEPFRRRGERVRVSTNGGGQPKWRGDGKELFYLSNGAMMAVNVREGATGPEVGIPVVLVSAEDLRAVTLAPDFDDYAVTSDGQRFLVKRMVEEGKRQRIHVLLDWPSLLE
jgi:eukaryotic-like serine/threonine-protein kinase